MSEHAISVQRLGKEYFLSHASERPSTLYELVGHALSRRNLAKRAVRPIAAPERFNALRDVSFDVQPGEVMGVIGGNGAGKSTLLKILSRITAPTTGRVKVRGRLSSLLEVGTGFHPELSGRENIFLNGAILGMTRSEVAFKYDEIVAFAEVERFIDTPVKRYSSGMYVRLAFAVAAHLEPDVLIIDEVLAVGDAAFQAKCLGKINAVANGGRTVLFVSHNMQAVQSLCSRCLWLDCGEVAELGQPEAVIAKYLATSSRETETVWKDDGGMGDSRVRLLKMRVSSESSDVDGPIFPSNANVVVEMNVRIDQPTSALCVGFDLLRADGSIVLRSFDTDVAMNGATQILSAGYHNLSCIIPRGLLNAGLYQLAPRIGVHNQEWILNCNPLVSFSAHLNHGETPFWNVLQEGNRPGVMAPIFRWAHLEYQETP